jgi:hypothetical protein
MSLDVTSDTVIDSIAEVAESAANTALSAALGESAVVTVRKWPVTAVSQVGANNLPLLAVSRVTDQEEDQTLYDQIERTTVRIAYIAPATPSDSVEARWPLLRAVFNAVIRALREGVYPQYGDNESAMSLGGVSGYVQGSARVVYSLLAGADTMHPSFIATAVFQTTGEELLFQRDDLDNLETVAAEIAEPDALAATEPVPVTVEYDWSE